jgi:RNA polymerase sigma-70 factor (sigma-E family)
MDDFDDFVRSRADELLRLAYLMCGDRHQAEDLLQEVLERMYLRWRRISVSPEAYARRALVNRTINHWRWRRRHREVPLDHVVGPTVEPMVEDHAGDVSSRARVVQLLGTLGRRQRAAIVLRYLNGLSVAEVADLLGCSEPTVRSHTFRGLAKLRAALPAAALIRNGDLDA